MKRVIICSIVFFIATFTMPVVMFTVILNNKVVAEGIVPGKIDFKIDKDYTYTISNNYKCVYNNKSYSLEKEIPNGWEIVVNSKDAKTPVKIDFDSSMSSTSGNSASVSIGEFKAVPGKYVLSVKGNGKERPFSIQPSLKYKFLTIVLPTLLVTILAGLISFCIGVWGLIDIIRSKTRSS